MTLHLRSAMPALVLIAIALCPVASYAHASNGSDGQFHPTVSTMLDSAWPVFNFTSIYIPNDVTVRFSDVASARPIEFLATENIHIAGTIEAGANGLWIETPGDMILSGSLNSIGGPLFLVAASINVSGLVNNTPGGDLYLTARNIAISSNRGSDPHPTARSGEIVINNYEGGDLRLTAGNGSLVIDNSGGGDLYLAAGGGDIAISSYGGNILLRGSSSTSCEHCLVSAPIPEPDTWIMLTAGLAALRVLSQARFPRKRTAPALNCPRKLAHPL